MNDRVDARQTPYVAWNHYDDYSCMSQRLIVKREKNKEVIIELFAAVASIFFLFQTSVNLKCLETEINETDKYHMYMYIYVHM